MARTGAGKCPLHDAAKDFRQHLVIVILQCSSNNVLIQHRRSVKSSQKNAPKNSSSRSPSARRAFTDPPSEGLKT